MKCTCHGLALCAQYAFRKLPSNLDYLLSEVARWFKCSIIRRSEYQYIFKTMANESVPQGKFITPSNTRLLVKGKCIFSIVTNWDELYAYFSVISTKDYHARVLHEMLADKRNYLYLVFALPIIQDIEKVNAAFQATNADDVKVLEDLKYLRQSIANRVYVRDSNISQNSNILPT